MKKISLAQTTQDYHTPLNECLAALTNDESLQAVSWQEMDLQLQQAYERCLASRIEFYKEAALRHFTPYEQESKLIEWLGQDIGSELFREKLPLLKKGVVRDCPYASLIYSFELSFVSLSHRVLVSYGCEVNEFTNLVESFEKEEILLHKRLSALKSEVNSQNPTKKASSSFTNLQSCPPRSNELSVEDLIQRIDFYYDLLQSEVAVAKFLRCLNPQDDAELLVERLGLAQPKKRWFQKILSCLHQPSKAKVHPATPSNSFNSTSGMKPELPFLLPKRQEVDINTTKVQSFHSEDDEDASSGLSYSVPTLAPVRGQVFAETIPTIMTPSREHLDEVGDMEYSSSLECIELASAEGSRQKDPTRVIKAGFV